MWISVLIGTMVGAALGPVIDNLVKGTFRTRTHNTFLLFNEGLAEHQIAYTIYFIAMLSGTDFSVVWAKSILGTITVLSFAFYIAGVAHTTTYERTMKLDHVCPNDLCEKPLTRKTKLKLLRFNVIFTALSLGAAVIFALLAVKTPP